MYLELWLQKLSLGEMDVLQGHLMNFQLCLNALIIGMIFVDVLDHDNCRGGNCSSCRTPSGT
jgi:hypothetical protein